MAACGKVGRHLLHFAMIPINTAGNTGCHVPLINIPWTAAGRLIFARAIVLRCWGAFSRCQIYCMAANGNCQEEMDMACMRKADQKYAVHQKSASRGARTHVWRRSFQAAAASPCWRPRWAWTAWKRWNQRLHFICSPVFISLPSLTWFHLYSGPPGGRELQKRYEVSCLDGSKVKFLSSCNIAAE